MDKETKEILTEQRLLSEVLQHQGWPYARRKLQEYITELGNAFNVDVTGEPTKTLIDLQARKYASVILNSWLQELEASKDVVQENLPQDGKSHILNNEG